MQQSNRQKFEGCTDMTILDTNRLFTEICADATTGVPVYLNVKMRTVWQVWQCNGKYDV